MHTQQHQLNQRGLAHVGLLLLVVLVVAAVGFAGYRVWSNGHSADSAGQTAATNSAAAIPAAIKSTRDIDKASAALDQSSLDDVDPSSLDNDLNAVL